MSNLSLRVAAEEAPEACALICDERELSFEQLQDLSHQAIRAMPPGDSPVALVARPEVPHLSIVYACLDAGRPLLLLHARGSAGSQKRTMEQVGASHLFDGTWEATGCSPPRDGHRSDAILIPTSGSTGSPKIVVFKMEQLLASVQASGANLPLQPSSRWVLNLPYAHVGGLSVLTRCLHARCTVVVIRDASNISTFWDELAGRKATHLSLVPTQLSRTLAANVSAPDGLEVALIGGAPTPLALRQRAREARFPALYTYGLTESCSQAATQPLSDFDEEDVAEDSGSALPGFEVRIGDGSRIELRGPGLFDRYYGQPKRHPDDWFATSDLGKLNHQGRLQVHGRSDNLLISGGENVSPEQVEAALVEHAAVTAVCVFGVTDTDWGQRVVALVAGDAALESELRAFATSRLPAASRPKDYVWCDALPNLENGKLDRREAQLLGGELLRS